MQNPVIENGKNIIIHPVAESRIDEVDMDNVPFGKSFSDHMFVANFRNGVWETPEIVPYGNLAFTPALSALNYGQSIFEGMKAYKSAEGDALLFRAKDNYNRMNRSAERMCMPPIPEHIFMDGIKELVKIDRQWIPDMGKGTLYIRPLYFATDEFIGVRHSNDYTFVAFTCPVGAYYNEPVDLLATKEFVRACISGTGNAKTAGNYAGAMLPDKIAKEQGYHNVLWLDGRDHLYIEECGTMNVFFVVGDTVLTPTLAGTILPGITRSSVLRLLSDNGYKVETRRISIHEIEEAYEIGMLKEAFGTGTAASVAHIAHIGFAGKRLEMPPVSERKIGPWLSETLHGIKHGEIDDPYGWVEKV
ncbi:branched-chain amino acid aminotransferase [bacterium]|nr:branched-chain amino acid aminotransferase [bacterium]